MKLSTPVAIGIAAGLILAACQAAATPTPTPPPVAAVDLFLMADTVIGPKNLTEDEKAAGGTCVQQNIFAKNEQIVWRVRVSDPATGAAMDDQALSSVVVVLPDQRLDMSYRPHPRDNPLDYFWTVSFTPPATYPSGLLPYTIEATAADGRTGSFNQFAIAAAQLKVSDEVRPEIAPTPAPAPTT